MLLPGLAIMVVMCLAAVFQLSPLLSGTDEVSLSQVVLAVSNDSLPPTVPPTAPGTAPPTTLAPPTTPPPLTNFSQSHAELLEYIRNTTFPDQTLEQVHRDTASKLWARHWNDLDWIRNPNWRELVESIASVQREFLSNPTLSNPIQPVLYRPVLPGMGWGNLVYDLSFHALFAFMLRRPLLVLFDKKDPSGALGWNATHMGVLTPNIIDWRWGKTELLRNYPPKSFQHPSPKHIIATCRQGTEFHSLCGGDQDRGNFAPLFDVFRQHPHKPIYSEFSASFIMPLKNSAQHAEWITTHLCADIRRRVDCQIQFAFSVLFRVSPEFQSRELFPRLAKLTRQFTQPFATAHIRTGHKETGISRGQAGFASDLLHLQQCQAQYAQGDWLVLTDTLELALGAAAARTGTMITLDQEYSLETGHVGYNVASSVAWETTLRDWLLLVQSTGPIVLRSRMDTAFSFGQRGGLVGGKQCAMKRTALLTCGDHFFDQGCAFDLDGAFPSTNKRRLLKWLG